MRLRREAYVFMEKQQWEDALQHLDRLIQADATGWRDRLERARVLARLQRQKEAEAELARLVVRHPRDPELWIKCGSVYARLGEWEKAVAGFTKGLDLGGREQMVWYRRALEGAPGGDPGAFERVRARLLQHAVSRKPDDPEVWIERGLTSIEAKQWQKAIGDFTRAIALQPDTPGRGSLGGTRTPSSPSGIGPPPTSLGRSRSGRRG
jgi:tetratricopeptide (TPR) repeat protein